MDFVQVVDSTIDFCKDKINKAMEVWEGFDEDQKRLYIGCAAVVVTVIVVAAVFYGLGSAHGRNAALEDEDF